MGRLPLRGRPPWVVAAAALSVWAASQAPAAEVPFAAPVSIDAAADSVRAVHAADLDGDGDLDLLAASAADDTIAWYANAGAGTLGAAQDITDQAVGAVAVFAADLDRDGDLDVLSASAGDDTIAWYENTAGDGSAWTAHSLTSTAAGATWVHAADVDGDGRLDVLSASADDDTIAWYENLGGAPPTFTARVVTEDPDGAGGIEGFADGAAAVFAGDVDGDGDVDLLSASEHADVVAWHENTAGDGSAWTDHAIAATADGARGVVASDVDGDGDLDALAASSEDDSVVWHENTAGDGSAWAPHAVSTSSDGARRVVAADLDRDGDADVLAVSFEDDTVAWHENTAGDGSAWTARVVTNGADGARGVGAADVDGDGDLDVLAVSSEDDTVAWHENTTLHREAAIERETVLGTGADFARAVFAADLDGDGDVDALAASEIDDTIAWYENTDGAGGFGPEQVITTATNGAYAVFAADVDGDGDLDVLSASNGDAEVAWYANDGTGSFGPQQLISTVASGARAVHAADLDHDGDTDVLSASAFDDTVAWYENTAGDGTAWTEWTISTSADQARWVTVGDVDGDGHMDVLSASANDDKIAWYESDGATPPSFTERVITEDPDGPGGADGFAQLAASVFAADVDGDGDTDALSAASGQVIAWYENTAGDGTAWTAYEISGNALDARSVVATDVDGDGDMDALSASKDDHKVAWYENTAGDGSAWTEHAISTNSLKAFSVFAADVDGDGDVDALSASRDDDKIAWYENRGGQFGLDSEDVAPLLALEGTDFLLLRVGAIHAGRASDADLELATLELLFEESPGDPLSDIEANALVASLRIHRDDGSGVFESGTDPLVQTVATLALTAGAETVAFADGDPNVQVAQGTPVDFFVVAELAADAASQQPAAFRVTHLTESSSSAEDRDTDLPLLLTFAENVTAAVDYIATSLSDFDGDGLLDVHETGTGVFLSPTDTGTDPFAADSDGDGFEDGVEVEAGTDPNDSEKFPMVPGPGLLGRAFLALAFVIGAARVLRSWPGRAAS